MSNVDRGGVGCADEAGELSEYLACIGTDKFKNPQRGKDVGKKDDHHENKIRNINFESDENSLSNGKQKKRKIFYKVTQKKLAVQKINGRQIVVKHDSN